jgi:phage FluMu protein Com
MANNLRSDLLAVRCGGCGKPLTVRLTAVKTKRTINCRKCEKPLPRAEAATRGARIVR